MSSLLAFVIAMTATGRAIKFSIEKFSQTLIAGSSGSGKSVVLNTILFKVVPLYGQELIVIIFDPKQISFTEWYPYAYVYENPREYLQVAQALTNEAERRFLNMKKNGKKVFTPSAETPRVFILVDECP